MHSNSWSGCVLFVEKKYSLLAKPNGRKDVMTDPRELNSRDYTYDLPNERIAKYPLEQRDSSLLLVYAEGKISHSVFHRLGDYLPAKAMLVFNDTRVIHARMLFRRPSGALIECFCLEPANQLSPEQVFASVEPVSWVCMVGNLKKWKEDSLEKTFSGSKGDCILYAVKKSQSEDGLVVEFSWSNNQYSFAEVMECCGELPIPPYLNREAEEGDEIRYNTVYAHQEGSVAAPTAGLHFTNELMAYLEASGRKLLRLTLHVGAGTFKPVKSEKIGEHKMHSERFEAKKQMLQQLMKHTELGLPVVAVGTTAVRTLESIYWLGCSFAKSGGNALPLVVPQWLPYDMHQDQMISPAAAIKAVVNFLEINNLEELSGFTEIIIAPGYTFRIVDGLITNFHQPDSTLLLLVAALVGDDWRKIYAYALENNFRFLSFGDSSLLMKNKSI